MTQNFLHEKCRRGLVRCSRAIEIWCIATSQTRGGIAHQGNTMTYLPGYFLNHCTKYSIAVGTLAARTCVCFRGIDRLRRVDQSVKWKHQVFCLRFLFLAKTETAKRIKRKLGRCTVVKEMWDFHGCLRVKWVATVQLVQVC